MHSAQEHSCHLSNMIKKEYLTPAIEVVVMDPVSMIATSPEFTPGTDKEENEGTDVATKQKNDFLNHTWE